MISQRNQRKTISLTTMTGKLFIVSWICLSLGCSVKEPPRVIYVSTPLSLPAKPELPRMKSNELECIADSSKWTLLKRDVILKNYISELETIIKSTQKN